MIVHEAAATVVAVYHALIAWLIVAAVFTAMVAGAAVACVAPGTRGAVGAWRWLRARLAPAQPSDAPQEHRDAHSAAQPRRVPSWARTDHHRFEEAA